MNLKWQKILVIAHCIGLILCIGLLVGFRYYDHLRWGLGYLIVWFTTLSAFAIFFVCTGKKWLNILAKIYSLGWLAAIVLPIPVTLGVWTGLLEEIYIPHKKYYEDDNYIIRQGYYGWIDYPNCALWIKDGTLERYDFKFDSFFTVDSCKVLSDLGAMVLYGESFKIEDNDSEYLIDILPLDEKVFDEHRQEIDSLKLIITSTRKLLNNDEADR
ncbi:MULTISPECIES: hypothetical protein [Sanguibacteroides]|uniref:Uncharacterized protein n=1 Tax=Sanguibacteroides justesenii TaxID=1547597 RepID=A0A0C3NKQ0_9PORP|nr:MULTISPECIES: hypothetical protein [Sanguibacteroides]KIO46792.1 hypothetical protein BA92_02740 [Sanguibacteroides justesenii]PXZ43452.1 hypothetical protein DMB45_08805 [Sanguibacteroides justesenii]